MSTARGRGLVARGIIAYRNNRRTTPFLGLTCRSG